MLSEENCPPKTLQGRGEKKSESSFSSFIVSSFKIVQRNQGRLACLCFLSKHSLRKNSRRPKDTQRKDKREEGEREAPSERFCLCFYMYGEVDICIWRHLDWGYRGRLGQAQMRHIPLRCTYTRVSLSVMPILRDDMQIRTHTYRPAYRCLRVFARTEDEDPRG